MAQEHWQLLGSGVELTVLLHAQEGIARYKAAAHGRRGPSRHGRVARKVGAGEDGGCLVDRRLVGRCAGGGCARGMHSPLRCPVVGTRVQAALVEKMDKAAKSRDERQRGLDREKQLVMQQIEADKAERKDRSWR